METGEWKERRFSNFLRTSRLESQKKANASKPELSTADVLETRDFIFSSIKPLDRVGDSGNLLLAKRKKDRNERYLIKHEFCDCAANEFVYSKIARVMGLHIPESKLFHISHGEKRNCFKSGYTVGARYLTLLDDDPAYEIIRGQAVNWEEFHSFWALFLLFLESDSFEIVLAEDSHIYRVDTTASFFINENLLSKAGLNIETEVGNVQEIVKDEMLRSMNRNFGEYSDFHKHTESWIKKYGDECRNGFFDSF